MTPHREVRRTFDALWPGVRRRLLGPADGGPVLLGIDGRSGSGKTDLALCLTEAVLGLGLSCAVVHLDDLYPGWDGLAEALEPLCAEVVTPLRLGQDGSYASWDWRASRPGPRRTVAAASDVVVLEGVGVLASPCANLLDLRIWLEAPSQVRKKRALARDGEVFAPYWQGWADQEDALFQGVRPRRVDAVADTVTATVHWVTLAP